MGEQTFWVIRKESVLLSQRQACQTVKTSTLLPSLPLLMPVAGAAGAVAAAANGAVAPAAGALLMQALVLLLACLAAVACLQ